MNWTRCGSKWLWPNVRSSSGICLVILKKLTYPSVNTASLLNSKHPTDKPRVIPNKLCLSRQETWRRDMIKTSSYYSPHNWLCPNPALLTSVHCPTKAWNSNSVLFPKVGLIHHPRKAYYDTIKCSHKLIFKFSAVWEEIAVTSCTALNQKKTNHLALEVACE
jgi:hypothetical protein